jgi:2-phosphosulfolactate phosphatase
MSFLQTINVHFLPALVAPEQLAGKTVAVIDVLRATTTIVQALAAGAKEVVPCLEVSEAKRKAARCKGRKLLGGERGGVSIEGFNLGNSPAEYTSKAVKGKTVFFTTTNGTRAMHVCKPAERVLLAAFTNYSALCERLADVRGVELVCAGTEGHISREDVLLAGAIASRLGTLRNLSAVFTDSACIVVDSWMRWRDSQLPLETTLLDSRGGANLLQIGKREDIALAAEIDKHAIVPELLVKKWKIVAAK